MHSRQARQGRACAGPFVVGLSLSVDVWAAGVYSGSGVSPWRVFGPGIVFHCQWNVAWLYFLGGAPLHARPSP